MSYNCNINETKSVKHVINVNSKSNVTKNKNDVIKNYKVNTFKNPKINTTSEIVSKKKPFSYHKPTQQNPAYKVDEKKYSKMLEECKQNVVNDKNNTLFTIDKYQTVKYIEKGPETSKFRLFYNKDKNKVVFLSQLIKCKNSKIDNEKNDAINNSIISTILPKLRIFKEDYKKKLKSAEKISYSSFSSDYDKSTKMYNSKKVDLQIDNKKRNVEYNLTKNFKNFNVSSDKSEKKVSKNFTNYKISKNNNIKPPFPKNCTAIKEEKKDVYKHDAKIVHMNAFPKHNRCCPTSKISTRKIDPKDKIVEIDKHGNKWKLLNDANESVSLVNFGKDIQKHFVMLNSSNKENLNRIFLAELGGVKMSINGQNISTSRVPQSVFDNFLRVLPNMSDRKLVSCFAQEGILSKSFLEITKKFPDILKYAFYNPKLSYKINKIDENTFGLDVCSIAHSRDYSPFFSGSIPFKDQKIHSYGMKSNIIFSKISNPIIKNLFFIK
ncbi:hypothetical protein [Buchnera aphidicola]|uniref:hypothetical protein n=1 Tax=Buchnera aphidicola TaxID=9 RepID=UPI0031B859BC